MKIDAPLSRPHRCCGKCMHKYVTHIEEESKRKDKLTEQYLLPNHIYVRINLVCKSLHVDVSVQSLRGTRLNLAD